LGRLFGHAVDFPVERVATLGYGFMGVDFGEGDLAPSLLDADVVDYPDAVPYGPVGPF
jgi:hypothetical protein